jgi:hypothetical protein
MVFIRYAEVILLNYHDIFITSRIYWTQLEQQLVLRKTFRAITFLLDITWDYMKNSVSIVNCYNCRTLSLEVGSLHSKRHVSNQNYIHEGEKTILNRGNASNLQFRIFCFHISCQHANTGHKLASHFSRYILWMWNLVSHTKAVVFKICIMAPPSSQ